MDNHDGTLTATADSTEASPLTFTNTYNVEPTTVQFPVKKVVESETEGTEPEEWSYDFALTEGTTAIETVTISGSGNEEGTATYAAISYTAPGTHTYTITESATEGSENAGIVNGTTTGTVTVTVVDNHDGTLTATADSTEASPLTFTNTYNVEPTTVSFPVEKILTLPEGMTEEEEWNFEITVAAKDGAPAAEVMKGAVTNEKATVTFGPFEYTTPGTYKYDVTESGTVAGITNDATATKTVTVTVVDNHDGTLTATADYDEKSPLTFTNTRDTGDLKVTKTVKSDLAADANAEFKFTVTLDYKGINGKFGEMEFKDGVANFTLKDGESKSATGLPTEMGYKVTEEAADGFTTEKTGDTGTISKEKAAEAAFTNTRETGDLTVTKTVKSDKAADKNVEFEFTVTLADTTINGTYGDMTFKDGVATFTLKDGEKATAKDLPTTLEYTVEEKAADGFTTEKTGDTGTISKEKAAEAVFTNTRVTGDLTVTKKVESVVDSDKTVDFTFTVTLDDTTINGTYGDMTFKDGVAEFTLKNGESKIAKGLPTTVKYTVVETANPDFKTEKTGDTGEIAKTASKAEFTNTRITTDIEVKKIWDDADDVDEFRPAKITVHLMNGETEVDTAELNAENEWKYTFKDLPYSEGGKEIVYTVTEDAVAGYTPSIDGLVITNKHIPLTPVTHNPPVLKVIIGDEPDVKEKFTFTLTAISNTAGLETMPMPEGAVGKVKTVTIEAGVEYEFGEMSFSVPGTYVYEIAESDTKLEGYKYDPSVYTLTYVITKSPDKTQFDKALTVEKDGKVVEISTYTFENEYTAPTVEVKVNKVWDDGDDKDGIRPESISVKLLADGEDTGKIVELSKENNWTYTFTGLKAKKDGKEIVYTVAEKKIDGYTIHITGDMKTGYTITNRHIPPETPPTGDTQPIGLWTGIMGIALAGIGIVCFEAKKDKKRRA